MRLWRFLLPWQKLLEFSEQVSREADSCVKRYLGTLSGKVRGADEGRSPKGAPTVTQVARKGKDGEIHSRGIQEDIIRPWGWSGGSGEICWAPSPSQYPAPSRDPSRAGYQGSRATGRHRGPSTNCPPRGSSLYSADAAANPSQPLSRHLLLK